MIGMPSAKASVLAIQSKLAAWTVAVFTGQIPAPELEVPTVTGSTPPANISAHMSASGRKGGQIGGEAPSQDHDEGPVFQDRREDAKTRWKRAKSRD